MSYFRSVPLGQEEPKEYKKRSDLHNREERQGPSNSYLLPLAAVLGILAFIGINEYFKNSPKKDATYQAPEILYQKDQPLVTLPPASQNYQNPIQDQAPQAASVSSEAGLPKMNSKPVNLLPLEEMETNADMLSYLKNVDRAYSFVDRGERKALAFAFDNGILGVYLADESGAATKLCTFDRAIARYVKISNPKVVDVTNDGKPDVLFLDEGDDISHMNGFMVASEQLRGPREFSGICALTDMNGNGIPEITSNGAVYEWNGSDFAVSYKLQSDLKQVANNIKSAAATDASERATAVNNLESTYPEDILAAAKEMMLSEPGLNLTLANKQAMISMNLKEYLALTVVQSLARGYNQAQQERSRRESEYIMNWDGTSKRPNPNYVAPQQRQPTQKTQQDVQKNYWKAGQDANKGIDYGRQKAGQVIDKAKQGAGNLLQNMQKTIQNTGKKK